MSTEIDERVVQMQFDNAEFERNVRHSIDSIEDLKKSLDFDGCGEGLEEVEKKAKKVKLDVLGDSVSDVSQKFSILQSVALGALLEIGRKAEFTASRMIKSLSTDNITSGWRKYAEKTTSVQTIMAATGKSIGYINEQLDKLVWFTDETSYRLTDMTNNIGKFTSQGVELETAVTAMQGISTWASLAGQGVNEASRAMYNLSQALGVGAVKLMDWKSIENANMATKQFKEQALEAAAAAGTLEKSMDSLGQVHYKLQSSGAEVSAKNFSSTLSEGWFTSDVLLKTLGVYGDFANRLYEVFNTVNDSDGIGKTTSEIIEDLKELKGADDQTILDAGYTRDQIELIRSLADEVETIGAKAFFAAQEAKTFSEAIDSVKEAVASGWMRTFETVFGNYTQAKVLWTDLANALYEIFAEGGNARNVYLEEILGESQQYIKTISDLTGINEELVKSMREVGETYGYDSEEFMQMLDILTGGNDAMSDSIANLFLYTKGSKSFSEVIAKATSLEEAEAKQLTDLAIKYGTTSKEYNEYLDSISKGNSEYRETLNEMAKLAEEFGKVSGRDMIAESIINSLERLGEVLTTVREAFNEVFEKPADDIYELVRAVRNFTDNLPHFDRESEEGEKLYRTFKGLASVLKIFTTILKEVVNGIFALVSPLAGAAGGILDLTANIGDALVAFQEMIEETGAIRIAVALIVNGLSMLGRAALIIAGTLFNVFSEVVGLLKDVAVYISEITGLGKIFSDITDELFGFNRQSDEAREHTSLFVKIIAALVTGLEVCRSGIANLREAIQSKFEAPGFQKFHSMVESVKNSLTAAWNIIKNIFDKVKSKFKEVFGDFDVQRFLTLLTQLLTGGILSQVMIIVARFKVAMGSVGSLWEEILGLLEPVRKSIALWQQSIRANTLLKIAAAIGILATSLIALSFVKTEVLFKSLAAIEGLFAGLSLTMMATSKIFKVLDDLKNPVGLMSGYKSLIMVGAALLLVSKALVNVSKYEKDLWQSLGAVAALAALMEAMAVVNALIAHKLDGDSVKNALGMLIFIHGINVLIKALKSIDSADNIWEDYKKLAAVAGLLTGMYSVVAIASHFTSYREIKASIAMMSVSTLLLAAMVGLTKLTSKIPAEQINAGVQNLAKVALIIGGLEIVSAAASRISKGFNSFGATLNLAVATSTIVFLTGLATAIGVLGKNNIRDIYAGIGVLSEIAHIISVMEILRAVALRMQKYESTFRKTLDLSSAIAGIIALSAVAVAIEAFAKKFDITDFQNGIEVIKKMTAVVVVVDALNAVIRHFDDSEASLKKTFDLIAMVNSISKLAIVVGALGLIAKNDGNLTAGTVVIGAMMVFVGAMTAFMNHLANNSGDNFDKFAKSVTRMVGAVAALGILTAVLGALPIYFLAKGAVTMIVLSGMILALSSFVSSLSKLDKSSKSYKSAQSYKEVRKLIWSCVGMVAALGAVATALGFVPVEKLIQGGIALGALGIFITAMSGLIALISLIPTETSRSITTMASMGAMALAIAGLIPSIKILGSMDPTELLIGSGVVGAIGLFLVACSAVMNTIAMIPSKSISGKIGALAGPLAIVIGITAMVPAIKELAKLRKEAGELGPLVGTVAAIGGIIVGLYAIAAAVGALSGGIGVAAMGIMAAGMIITAKALEVMVQPLKELSAIKESLGKMGGGLALLGLGLVGLSVGCIAMTLGLGGVVALKMIVPTLRELADIIPMFTNIQWETFGKAIGMTTLAILGLGAALTVIGLVSGLAIPAAGALVIFSGACAITALALDAFASAMQKFDDSAVAGVKNFASIGATIAQTIVDIKLIVAEGTGEVLKTLAHKIKEAAPDIYDALSIYVPMVAELWYKLMLIVAEYTPYIIAAFLYSLAENYDKIKESLGLIFGTAFEDAFSGIADFLEEADRKIGEYFDDIAKKFESFKNVVDGIKETIKFILNPDYLHITGDGKISGGGGGADHGKSTTKTGTGYGIKGNHMLLSATQQDTSWMAEVGAKFSTWWNSLWNKSKEAGEKVNESFENGLTDASSKNLVKQSTKANLFEPVETTLNESANTAHSGGLLVVNKYASAIGESSKKLVYNVNDKFVKPILESLENSEKTLFKSGQKTIESVSDGAEKEVPESKKTLKDIGKELLGSLEETLGIDPNKLHTENMESWIAKLDGSKVVESMVEGMASSSTSLLAKVEDIGKGIHDALVGGLKSSFNGMNSLFDDIFSKFDEFGEKVAGISNPFGVFSGLANASSVIGNPFAKFEEEQNLDYANWLNDIFREMSNGIDYEDLVSNIGDRFNVAWAAKVGSIGSNIFTPFDDEQKYWAWDLTDIMLTQVEGVTGWLDNYYTLMASGLNKEFIDYLYSLGISGSGFVKEYIALIENENIEELERASEAYTKVMESAATEALFNSETQLQSVKNYKSALQEALELGATPEMMEKFRKNGKDNQEMLQSWLHMTDKQRADYISNWNELASLQETTNTLTYEETKEIMTKNIELVSKWKEDTNKLVGKACDEILDAIREAGPESQELLQQMLMIPDDKWGEINKLYEQAQELALNGNNAITPELMLANIKSQTTGVSQYYSKLGELAATQYSEGLKQYIRQYGPYDQTYLNTLLSVKDNKNYVTELNEQWNQMSLLEAKYMKQNMESQLEGFRQWLNDYNKLKSVGISSTILAAIESAGPDDQKMLQAILASIREQQNLGTEALRSEVEYWNKTYDEVQKAELRSTGVTVEDMVSNMKSNLSAYAQVYQDLDTLTQNGLNNGILRTLKEKGLDAAEQIHVMAEAIRSDVHALDDINNLAILEDAANAKNASDNISDVLEKYQRLNDTITELAKSDKVNQSLINMVAQTAGSDINKALDMTDAIAAALETMPEVVAEMSNAALQNEDLIGNLTQGILDAYNSATEGAINFNEDNKELHEANFMNTLLGLNPEDQAATKTNLDAALKEYSNTMNAAGEDVSDSFAKGIDSGAVVIKNTLSEIEKNVEDTCYSMVEFFDNVIAKAVEAEKKTKPSLEHQEVIFDALPEETPQTTKKPKPSLEYQPVIFSDSSEVSTLTKVITAGVSEAYAQSAKASLEKTNSSSNIDNSTNTTSNNVVINQNFSRYESSPAEIYLNTYQAGLA